MLCELADLTVLVGQLGSQFGHELVLLSVEQIQIVCGHGESRGVLFNVHWGADTASASIVDVLGLERCL